MPRLNNICLTVANIPIHVNRVYAQPYYVLRQAKYYVEGKKGVCATYNVLRKLKKDKVTNRCNLICSLLNRNLSVVDDNFKKKQTNLKMFFK